MTARKTFTVAGLEAELVLERAGGNATRVELLERLLELERRRERELERKRVTSKESPARTDDLTI